MFEITQLMKDDDYPERIYFIIVGEEDSKFYNQKKNIRKFTSKYMYKLGLTKLLG